MAPENAQIASERRSRAGGYSRWGDGHKAGPQLRFLTKLHFPARKKAQLPSGEGALIGSGPPSPENTRKRAEIQGRRRAYLCPYSMST